jgi:hypothetical protein
MTTATTTTAITTTSSNLYPHLYNMPKMTSSSSTAPTLAVTAAPIASQTSLSLPQVPVQGIIIRDAPDTVFAGYPTGRIAG